MKTSVKKLSHIGRIICALIFPPRCPACRKVTGSLIEGDLCEKCRITFAESYVDECPRCGMKPESCKCVPDVMGTTSDRSPYTTVFPLIFSGYYIGYSEDSIISTVIYRLKRDPAGGSKRLIARIIAQAVSRSLTLQGVDPTKLLVTYIPRSESAMRKYGFDHMETVAKYTSEMLDCKFERLLIRKGGESQKELSGDERRSNAYNSIFINPAKSDMIRGSRILILDDVITTGSTMRAAVTRLSLAGADTIIPAAAMVSKTGKYKKK